MRGVDGMDSLYAKPPPGKSAQEVLRAVNRMILMGAEMDWPALQEAARAHVTAIKSVLSQDSFTAVLTGLGKAISSVPKGSVMNVYNEMARIAGTNSGIPAYLFAKQNPTDAKAAYSALIEFTDTVKSAQPETASTGAWRPPFENDPLLNVSLGLGGAIFVLPALAQLASP